MITLTLTTANIMLRPDCYYFYHHIRIWLWGLA